MRKRPNRRPTTAVDRRETRISGLVEHIVYRSEETGYTVFVLVGNRPKREWTVVGQAASLWEGESVEAEGRWVRHREHGHQFQADAIRSHAPVNAEGIRRYLASGLVRGIGPVMAERLVAAFGDATLAIIDKESTRLRQVPGIGPKRKEQIKRAWDEQKAVRDIMVFLHSHTVGTAQAVRIHRRYGSEAIARITENPYRLSADIWGIGFRTADRIAASLGVPTDSPLRARAGIRHVLREQTEEGHCRNSREALVSASHTLLDIDEDILAAALAHQVNAETLIDDAGQIYLAPLYYAERGIVARLRQLLETPIPFKPIDVKKATDWAERRMGLTFEPLQHEAVANSLSRKVSIITGGPGVGKTTITRALVDVFKARRLRVLLAAPTGRAAKRLGQSTSCPAKTLHRLLKYNPSEQLFEHGPENPLRADIVILDEVSMIDVVLMNAFLRALPASACLVLIGDADQLPSVGPGNVLKDLIRSSVVSCVRLQKVFRQGERSWIIHNAHLVHQGRPFEMPETGALADFYFVEANNPEDTVSRMLHLVTNRIPTRFGMEPRSDIQVLSPMQRNQLGAANLNTLLQQELNPTGASVTRFGQIFREGDRVMQLRNNYEKDVFNGDIGVLRAVDENERQATVVFDGRSIPYEFTELDELGLAYASSIHKAQGSEYPAVVLVLATQHYKLLQRNLLYTAITRGRRLVCVVGSRKAVHLAISNNRVQNRRTGLAEALGGSA